MSTLVAVVDDDEGMRHAMRRVLETDGFATELFGSAEAFLASHVLPRAQCLILDVHLSGMSGIELQRHLRAMGYWLPTVFVSARPAAGMQNCLLKPFPAEALIHAVNRSIGK